MYFTSPFWIYIPSGFLITCPFKLYIISDPKDPFIISIICELPHGSFVSQSIYSTTKNSTYSVSIIVSNTVTSTYSITSTNKVSKAPSIHSVSVTYMYSGTNTSTSTVSITICVIYSVCIIVSKIKLSTYNVSVINTGTSTYTVSHGSTGGSQFIGRVGSAPFSSPASTQSSHPSFNQEVCTHPNGAY